MTKVARRKERSLKQPEKHPDEIDDQSSYQEVADPWGSGYRSGRTEAGLDLLRVFFGTLLMLVLAGEWVCLRVWRAVIAYRASSWESVSGAIESVTVSADHAGISESIGIDLADAQLSYSYTSHGEMYGGSFQKAFLDDSGPGTSLTDGRGARSRYAGIPGSRTSRCYGWKTRWVAERNEPKPAFFLHFQERRGVFRTTPCRIFGTCVVFELFHVEHFRRPDPPCAAQMVTPASRRDERHPQAHQVSDLERKTKSLQN
jgi:hypothetical protein